LSTPDLSVDLRRLDDVPAFLTVDEAAAILRLGRTAAYEAASRGQLPTVRFGRRLRVPRGALLELARERRVRDRGEQPADQQEHRGDGAADRAATEAGHDRSARTRDGGSRPSPS
jgi:excisionase family DNA binding protein